MRGVPGSGPATKPGTKSLDRHAFKAPGGAISQGYCYVGTIEPDARAALAQAEKEALAQNWTPRQPGREPTLKPIPPAPKK